MLILSILLFYFKKVDRVGIVMIVGFSSLLGALATLSFGFLNPNIIMGGLAMVCLLALSPISPILYLTHFQRLRLAHKGALTHNSRKKILLECMSITIKPLFLIPLSTCLVLVPLVLKISVNYSHPSISFDASSVNWWRSFGIPVIVGIGFSCIISFFLVPLLLLYSPSQDRLKK